MQNPGLDESQAGIKISGGNINSSRFTDDTTLMAESEEELKNLLIRETGESKKAGLQLYIQKIKIISSGPIILWQINGRKVATVTDFIFLGCKITADKIKRHLLLGRKALPNLDRV